MNDTSIAQNLLNLEKGVCDLYLHGTVEAATDNVRSTFSSGLNENLSMQKCIYDQLSSMGMYPRENVEQQKISCVKQKFSS